MSQKILIEHFTDPACPFAFSLEPVRYRLRWHYGDQLEWRTRMIVLTLEPGEAAKLAGGAPGLQRRYGMPISPEPYPRETSSEPACRAVVGARVNRPGVEESLLRRLRVNVMAGGLLDDPELIAAAACEAGIERSELESWEGSPEVATELERDIADARRPSPAARALAHKLGGPPGERRYTAPSYELSDGNGNRGSIPGFNPVEVYETAIANLAPELVRRGSPTSVEELLDWAGEPLATAEVALVMQRDPQAVRAELGRVASAIPAGADMYWVL